MQIAFHFGMPFTDDDQLLWSLRRDRAALDAVGVHVPRPRFYRDRVAKAVTTLRGSAPGPDEQAAMLTDIGARGGTTRLILSDPQFICGTKKIWHEGEFYGKAGFKSAWLRAVFSHHEPEFFLCIRNPATFLSALLRSDAPMTLDEHLRGGDPGAMFWSGVIDRMRTENPGVPITVWCHEEAPAIWPIVLAAVAGVETDVPLAGSKALARPLLSEVGQANLDAILGSPVNVRADEAAIFLAQHLEVFADPDQAEEEIDIPGWDASHLAAVTAAYEEDLERIALMEGVEFLGAELPAENLELEPAPRLVAI